eukprot:CAMPEP_0119118934 /NCGR_PEP_ID=MMETSP1310-20130426/646_1 /TAXON_ID=464262 /ORGANISM="Genus nov. species nov., Strain RCC2339" /LENGTH=33 /DNA_ID= /DNA_START= /DNA_END= /DNA_ORIENTATION=
MTTWAGEALAARRRGAGGEASQVAGSCSGGLMR